MRMTGLMLMLCVVCAGVLLAQGGTKKYSLSVESIDFGLLTEYFPVRERIALSGLERMDQISAEMLRFTEGVRLDASYKDARGQRGFYVTISPSAFEAGKHSDRVLVLVNKTKVGEVLIAFEVAESASKKSLTKLVIFAKEGDDFTKNALIPLRDAGADKLPDLKYGIDLRLVHEPEYLADYERRRDEAALGGRQMNPGWPALFLGPIPLAVGQTGVNAMLEAAIAGQDFAKPMPVVSIYISGDPQRMTDTRDKLLPKYKATAPGIVWMVKPMTLAPAVRNQLGIRPEADYVVEYPRGDGRLEYTQGVMAELERTISELCNRPMQPSDQPSITDSTGTGETSATMASGNFKSEGTSVGAGAQQPAATSSETSGKGSLVWMTVILGIVGLGVGTAVFIVMRKQQAILAQVTQRLAATDHKR